MLHVAHCMCMLYEEFKQVELTVRWFRWPGRLMMSIMTMLAGLSCSTELRSQRSHRCHHLNVTVMSSILTPTARRSILRLKLEHLNITFHDNIAWAMSLPMSVVCLCESTVCLRPPPSCGRSTSKARLNKCGFDFPKFNESHGALGIQFAMSNVTVLCSALIGVRNCGQRICASIRMSSTIDALVRVMSTIGAFIVSSHT